MVLGHPVHILSVNEKLPLLKFRYFGNYNRNPDSYFYISCFWYTTDTSIAINLFCYPRNYGAAAARAFCAFCGFSKFENIIFKNNHAVVCLNDIP